MGKSSLSPIILIVILSTIPISIASETKIVEDLGFSNIAPEIATVYIGEKFGFWPEQNITGLQAREHFKTNGRTMSFISIRDDEVFGIYNRTIARKVAQIIDPITKQPLLNWVLGGPFSMSQYENKTATIWMLVSYNGSIEMDSWLNPPL